MDPRPQDAASILKSQHLRLLLDHLPFINDGVQFDSWLRRAPVSVAWAEFTAAIPRPSPNPDFSTVSPKARAALSVGASPPAASFRMLHPDKSNWSAEDHHVRFIVGVINDSVLEKPNERKGWVEKPHGMVRAVYEVLVYLKATAGVEEEHPGVSPKVQRPRRESVCDKRWEARK